MKATRYFILALLLSVVYATSALALPANRVLTAQLATVGGAGQVVPIRSIAVTTDNAGKVSFNFSNVPASDSGLLLMVRILDGTTVLRQSIVEAPAPNGAVNVGVSEVTTSQATAMLKAFADSGNNATLAAMIMIMVRSGAITTPDLRNISPMARGAASAFESFLTVNGAGGQLAAFRSRLVPAMRDYAAKYKESVDTVTLANDANTTNTPQDILTKTASNQREAAKRGEAVAQFLGALVNAGADVGISPALLHAALTEAGRAAEAAGTTVSSDVVASILAAFRTAAEHCQLRGEMRSYAIALPFMNATTATGKHSFSNMTTGGVPRFRNVTTAAKVQMFDTAMQQFNAGAATLGDAMVSAQETFELIYADPVSFPALQDIGFARDSLSLSLQSLMANFIADTTALPGNILTMQAILTAGMRQVGGVMAHMSTATLQAQGIGSMFTSATASSQNWLAMMVTGANFVNPAVQLTYSSAIPSRLVPQLAGNYPQLPAPPNYSLFADPYKSLLRLQFDLMLLKFNNQLAMSLAVQPISQADLAMIKETDLINRATILNSMGGSLTSDQKNALLMVMSQPELL